VLANEGIEISHTKLLDMLAKSNGHQNFESSKEKKYCAQIEWSCTGFTAYSDHGDLDIRAKNSDEAYDKFTDEMERGCLWLIGSDDDGTFENPRWAIPIMDIDIKGNQSFDIMGVEESEIKD
jgi:hypothetical protein